MSRLLFIAYFPSTISSNILIYISFNADDTFTRITFAIISLIGIGLQNTFIYFCSSISYSALNLTSDLYSFLIRRKSTIKQKLKISAFIEKLCGPSIGFYCYNLFPFNTFELFKFLIFVSSNYILLNGLMFD
jgi:hypothetical protein